MGFLMRALVALCLLAMLGVTSCCCAGGSEDNSSADLIMPGGDTDS